MNYTTLISLVLSLTVCCTTRSDELEAGFAQRDISPSIGMERAGNYIKFFHTAFADPCRVQAGVFKNGQEKVAMVSIDVLLVPRSVVVEARQRIENETGIVPGAVMLVATHSHTSGPVGIVQPGQYDAAPNEIRRLAYQESSLADADYLKTMTREIVEAVRLANARLAPAQLGFGRGHEDRVSFNRRIRMKNGQTHTNPRPGNPDALNYAGPIDPEVGVIGAWDLQGNLMGVVVNFACHATTNIQGISANWPGEMARVVQGAMRKDVPVLFLPGASGDITQIDNFTPYRPRKAEEYLQLLGGRIGAEVLKVLVEIPKTRQVEVAHRQRVWKIKRRAPDPSRVKQSWAVVARPKPPGEASDWIFAKETVLADFLAKTDPEVEVEVQLLQLGPAVCLGNPAELFVDYGLEMKRASSFPLTMVAELANGYVGYVPTEEAFSIRGGGYETRLTSTSNLDIRAGRQLTETILELSGTLRPGVLPALPPRPPFPGSGNPWAYGNLGPQVR